MSSRRCAWACLLLLAVAALADEGPAVVTGEKDARARAVAIERVLTAFDLAQEHHIAPPSRQEMLTAIAKAFCAKLGLQLPLDFESRLAECASRDDEARFLEWLRDLPPTVFRTGSNAELIASFVGGVAPGRLRWISTKEAAVDEQFRGNSYVGIGIALTHSFDANASEQKLMQVDLIRHGPAEAAGMLKGDLIESVDGEPALGHRMEHIVDRIRGPKGTPVTVVVRQPDAKQSRTLKITRGLVPRDTVHGWGSERGEKLWRVAPELPIAYVRISEIGGSVVTELQQLEERWQGEGVQALVIDLRHVHSSGSPHYAALFADALLDGGKIGHVRTRSGAREYIADRECLFRNWPLAVLVDARTKGTAEWVAAALKDNQRAVLVGHPTRGEALWLATVPTPVENLLLELATGVMERGSGTRLLRPRVLNAADPEFSDKPVPEAVWCVTPDEIIEPYTKSPLGRSTVGNGSAEQGRGMIVASRTNPQQADELALNKACEVLQKQLDIRREADKP